MQLGVTQTKNQMWFEWYLNGPRGANFILYPEKEHTDEDYMKAKIWLNNNHDVLKVKRGDYSANKKQILKIAVSTVNQFQKFHNVKL